MRLAGSCRRSTQSTLAIQGPPGSGKTYTGARMAVRLLAARASASGSVPMSHKVITHFLDEVLVAASEVVDVRPRQKVSDGIGALIDDPRDARRAKNAEVQAGLATGTLQRRGRHPWLWAAEKSQEMVDVLFVDEAGQMSLANVPGDRAIGSLDRPPRRSPAARSATPGITSTRRRSLGARAPPRRARRHARDARALPRADVATASDRSPRSPRTPSTRASSQSRPNLEGQRLLGPEPMRGAGVRMVEADHVGADSYSAEEAHQVAWLVRALVESRSTWIDKDGDEHPIAYEDVLVVAPYNAQVGAIAALLPPEARVGTVDKFQGQEAPVSIYSMTSSSPEDAPRGMYVPLLPQPAERGDLARTVRRDRRRGARAAPCPSANARADAPGQRPLPVRREGRGRRAGDACVLGSAGRPAAHAGLTARVACPSGWRPAATR